MTPARIFQPPFFIDDSIVGGVQFRYITYHWNFCFQILSGMSTPEYSHLPTFHPVQNWHDFLANHTTQLLNAYPTHFKFTSLLIDSMERDHEVRVVHGIHIWPWYYHGLTVGGESCKSWPPPSFLLEYGAANVWNQRLCPRRGGEWGVSWWRDQLDALGAIMATPPHRGCQDSQMSTTKWDWKKCPHNINAPNYFWEGITKIRGYWCERNPKFSGYCWRRHFFPLRLQQCPGRVFFWEGETHVLNNLVSPVGITSTRNYTGKYPRTCRYYYNTDQAHIMPGGGCGYYGVVFIYTWRSAMSHKNNTPEQCPPSFLWFLWEASISSKLPAPSLLPVKSPTWFVDCFVNTGTTHIYTLQQPPAATPVHSNSGQSYGHQHDSSDRPRQLSVHSPLHIDPATPNWRDSVGWDQQKI